MLSRRKRYEHELTIFDMENAVRSATLDITDETDNTIVFLRGNDIADYLISNFSNYYYRVISDKSEDDITNEDIESMFDTDYHNFVSRQYENLKRLYNAYYVETYNPLDNYYRQGTITTEYDGSEADTLVKSGSEVDTLVKSGSEVDTLVKSGTETDTLSKNGSENEKLDYIGSETINHTKAGTEIETIGQQSNTTTEKVSPETDETFYNTNKSDTTLGSQENSLSFNNRQDSDVKTFNGRYNNNTKTFTNREDESTKTFNNRQDATTKTFNNRQDATTKTFNNRQDTNTKTFNDRIDTETQDIHGNNGNISNQTLLDEELKIRNFDLLSWFVKKFVSEYLTPDKRYKVICFVKE